MVQLSLYWLTTLWPLSNFPTRQVKFLHPCVYIIDDFYIVIVQINSVDECIDQFGFAFLGSRVNLAEVIKSHSELIFGEQRPFPPVLFYFICQRSFTFLKLIESLKESVGCHTFLYSRYDVVYFFCPFGELTFQPWKKSVFLVLQVIEQIS